MKVLRLSRVHIRRLIEIVREIEDEGRDYCEDQLACDLLKAIVAVTLGEGSSGKYQAHRL